MNEDSLIYRLRNAEAPRDGSTLLCDLADEAADKLEQIYSFINSFIFELDASHQPEWSSEQAKQSGKDPYACTHCNPQESGWPCTHRILLDELKVICND